jgi:hypothetical protein
MYQELIRYLTPILGEATAINMLKHYCARTDLSAEEIKPAHLPELSRAMRPMLAVWLGSLGATRVSDEIAQLGRGTAAR